MSISKIQTGDKVKVISGKYRGTIGVVTSVNKHRISKHVFTRRISVTNIPQIVKYRKSVNYQGEFYPGSQSYIDRTLDISNVSLITEDSVVSKSKIEVTDGKKVRVLKKNQKPVIKEVVKEPSKKDETVKEKK